MKHSPLSPPRPDAFRGKPSPLPPSVRAVPEGKPLQHQVRELRAHRDVLREQLEAAEARAEALQRENEAIRREATLVRLYDNIATCNAEATSLAADDAALTVPDTPPNDALLLYAVLPPAFSLEAFFERADHLRITPSDARRCLLYFFGRGMITQRNLRFQKQRTSGKRTSGKRTSGKRTSGKRTSAERTSAE